MKCEGIGFVKWKKDPAAGNKEASLTFCVVIRGVVPITMSFFTNN